MNLDNLQRFPNQNIEDRPDECVGETWADIIGNIENQAMDAGYCYAYALWCNRTAPTTSGSNPYSGGVGGLVYGAIPTEDQPFDAETTSELYEANIDNYPVIDRLLALHNTPNALQGLFSYQDIKNYLSMSLGGAQLGICWYESFDTPNQDGTLPAPSGSFTNHCVAVYENTPLGLRIKPWLGPNYGADGYSFMSEATFNLVFQNASAFALGSRWWSLAYYGCTRPWLLKDIIPQLSGGKPTFT